MMQMMRMRSKTLLPYGLGSENLLSTVLPRAFCFLEIVRSLMRRLSNLFALRHAVDSLYALRRHVHASRYAYILQQVRGSQNIRCDVWSHHFEHIVLFTQRVESLNSIVAAGSVFLSFRFICMHTVSFTINICFTICRLALSYTQYLCYSYSTYLTIELRAGTVWTRCVDDSVLQCTSENVRVRVVSYIDSIIINKRNISSVKIYCEPFSRVSISIKFFFQNY